MAKVLIVDDHPAIRMAVNMLLKQDEHHVLGEVDNGVDAIAMARNTIQILLSLILEYLSLMASK